MIGFIGSGILTGVTEYLLFLVGRKDPGWSIRLSKREKIFVVLLDMLSCFLLYPCARGGQAGICLALLSVVQGCLLTACVMDLKEKMVYRYVWAVGGLAVGGLAVGGLAVGGLAVGGLAVGGLAVDGLTVGNLAAGGLVAGGLATDGLAAGGLFCHHGSELACLEYLFFLLLQQFLFSRMYGRADCHAFCVCGAVMFSLGGRFDDAVVHMAVTFVLLLVVQVCTGNVTWKGKLKKPVPMLPYITAGFWLWVDFNAGKWYIY